MKKSKIMKKNNASQRSLLSRSIYLVSCVCLLPSTLVSAQQTGSSIMLEQVIVTAEKRTQSLQDVPISIVAMDKDTLEKFNIDELEDFSAKVPN
ncbi:MAG: iron complex outermembrane receptor protein, partial [Paraglaciecola sp.]